MPNQPRVSVVIAAYQPGDAFARVIDSLDAQTLQQDRFEILVVDDGSPDDTFVRLTALAATRPNMRVERIENSGWPSRPRNVATATARGDYVLYMDHDDSLYRDALRRMVEYADETGADVLSPKESKTSDAWWGIPALADGNVPNAILDGGIDRLLPMVPHKLYRRAFLLEHGITFPDGRRQLWEDIFFNIEAWRHADRVAVLADTPAYLWHSSDTNNSKTYGPTSAEFWDRLDDLFAFIDATLDGDEHSTARRSALLHQYGTRILLRLSRDLQRASAGETTMALRRARAIQERYVPEAWDEQLGRQVRARSILLRQERPDLLATLWSVDADTACRVTATQATWQGGRLHLHLDARWLTKRGVPISLVRVADRLHRDLPQELRAALPDEVLDFTETLPDFRLQVGVRDRPAAVTWPLTLREHVEWVDLPGGRVAPHLTAETLLDPEDVAFGRPLESSVHDFVATLRWDAASRAGAVRYSGAPAPVILEGGTAVLYSSRSATLALDSSATVRSVLADGLPATGFAVAPGPGIGLALPKVQVFAPIRLPAAARLCTARGDTEYVLQGMLTASGSDARLDLETPSPIPSGMFELAFALDGGRFLGARPVESSGGVLTIGMPAAARPSRRASPVRRLLGRARNGLRRLVGSRRRRG